MATKRLMEAVEKRYHASASAIPESIEGKLFGKSCYKINKKAFCCFFKECMVFKLKEDAHTRAINLTGATLFDPSGKNRPMKEWVQVPVAHQEQWESLSHSAAAYVKEIS